MSGERSSEITMPRADSSESKTCISISVTFWCCSFQNYGSNLLWSFLNLNWPNQFKFGFWDKKEGTYSFYRGKAPAVNLLHACSDNVCIPGIFFVLRHCLHASYLCILWSRFKLNCAKQLWLRHLRSLSLARPVSMIVLDTCTAQTVALSVSTSMCSKSCYRLYCWWYLCVLSKCTLVAKYTRCVSGLCRIAWKYFQLQQSCLYDV